MSSRKIRSMVVVLSLALTAGWALAQGTTASVVGTVRDTAGGVIPGATVSTRNLATGVTRTTVTGDSGDYEIAFLEIGTYSIRAALPGFKLAEIPRQALEIGQRARINFTLEPGEIETTVTVETAAPLISTEKPSISHIVEGTQIADLPLNDRDVLEFIHQMPGVNDAFRAYTVAGARDMSTGFSLDGLNVTDERMRRPEGVPPVDAVQEMQVETSLMSADSGMASSKVSMALKSGTNDFHGSLYEYYRSNLWEARNFFNPTDEVPQRIRHQFGATLGGPIIRDRTHFFFSFAGLRSTARDTHRFLVPTDEMRAGQFPQSITNPFTEQVYSDGLIPQQDFHPVAVKLLEVYPTANVDDPQRNYFGQPMRTQQRDQYIARLDHRLSSSDQVYGMVSVTDSDFRNPLATGATDEWGSTLNQNRAVTTLIRHIRIFSPTTVNEFSLGFFRNNLALLPSSERNWLQELGIEGVPAGTPRQESGMIRVIMNPYMLLTDFHNYPKDYATNNFSFVNNLSWQMGRHAFKAGFDLRRVQMNENSRANTRGQWNFVAAPTGHVFASFLLGSPNVINATSPRDWSYFRKWDAGYFVEDKWSVSPWLTLNFGLRYERFTNPIELYDRISSFDVASGAVIVPSTDGSLPRRGIQEVYLNELQLDLVPSNQLGLPRSLAPTDNNNFAPRLGFALRPGGSLRTVLRGGYGIYYYPMRQNQLLEGKANPPFMFTRRIQRTVHGPLRFDVGPFARQDSNLIGNTSMWGLAPDYRNAYFQNWNLTLEREFGWNTAGRISYLGNRGTKLEVALDHNQLVATETDTGAIATARPFPNFAAVRIIHPAASSFYNAMELEFRKRYSNNLSFQVNWTWAKSLANNDADSFTPQDSTNIAAEWGNAAHVPRHGLNINSVYAFPFRWDEPFLNHMLGGWRMSMVSRFRSGIWYTPLVNHNQLGAGNRLTGRPDLLPGCNPNLGPRTVDQWFDVSCFAPVPEGENRFGTAGVGIIEGPGRASVDMAAYKTFQFQESQQLMLRIEVFNLANRANFDLGRWDLNITAPQNAAVISRARDARQFQFALRYDF